MRVLGEAKPALACISNTRPIADCDALVVGAGLAGLEVARRIALGGHRVMLVDVRDRLDRAVHTTGIFVRRTLIDFDLPEACLGPPVRHVVLHSPTGRRVGLKGTHDEFRVGRMGLLYLCRLAEAEAAGVEWLPGTRYECSTADDVGSAVWLSRGGRRFRVKTRLLIGADGATSRVAQHLGLDANRAHLVGVEDVVEGASMDGPPALHCFLDPVLAPGYIAWLANDGETAHIGVAGYAARFAPLDALRAFGRRLQESGVCDTRGAHRIERRGGRIPVSGILPRIANGRGLLVGDAAGAVSPLTAGGLDPCLRLSWYAAEVACHVLTSGSLAALSGYSGNLFRRRFRSRLLLRRVLASVRSRALAEMVVHTLSVPPFRALANHVFFARGSFPDPA